MGALQVWQSLSEAQGRGHGDRELAILFTDLVDFSDWALDAGDAAAVEHLREVGEAVEQPVRAHGGRVVKRLGDGLMAVFDDAAAAVNAACEASGGVGELDGPGLRAGVHVGSPRKLGGDYFGVDVNVAARVASAAGPRRGADLEHGARAARPGGDLHPPALALQAQGHAEGPPGVRRRARRLSRDSAARHPRREALAHVLRDLLLAHRRRVDEDVDEPALDERLPVASDGERRRHRAPAEPLDAHRDLQLVVEARRRLERRPGASTTTTSDPDSTIASYEPNASRHSSVSVTSKYANQFPLNTIPCGSHSW